jgi:hypothetical protein
MGDDDLANDWGRKLVVDEQASLPRRQPLSNRANTSQVPHLVRKDVPNFQLANIVNSGSDANLWAINEATKGSGVASCLIACGSYLAGDSSYLEQVSSSGFDPGKGICFIADPNATIETAGREHTIGLPYHLPGEMSPEQLSDLEKECFQELHMRCALGRMEERPYKAITLELILAGTGATLSDLALEKLAGLAKLHNLSIIVDEIMTAGRSSTTSMLLTSSKPPVFQDAVSYVTMGKWTNAGLVLRNNNLPMSDKTQSRGVTIPAAAKVTEAIWPVVVTARKNIVARRVAVFKKLNVKEQDCWGMGLLIFAPVLRTDSQPGLKSRFLPLANGTKIGITGLDRGRAASRTEVNTLVVKRVQAWNHFSKEKFGKVVTRHFCNILMSNKEPYIPIKQLRQTLMKHKFTRPEVSLCINDAVKAKYVVKAQKLKKRIRVVCIDHALKFPF